MRHGVVLGTGMALLGALLAVEAGAGATAEPNGPLAGIVERSYHGDAARQIIGRSRPTRPRVPAPPPVDLQAKGPVAPAKPQVPANVDVAKLSHTERYQDLIARYSKMHGLDEELVKAVIYVESGGNPRAVSSKGAAGLRMKMGLRFF